MIAKEQALDILDQLEFFQGQRAGRELWSRKNPQLQDIDIACFVKHITDLREYITNGGEWISVDDLLPDPYKDCLVTVKYKYKWEREWTYDVDTGHMAFMKEKKIDDLWVTHNDWDEGQEIHVTHWMPLPEPPKGV